MKSSTRKVHKPQWQILDNVCNGGHLTNLLGWSTTSDPQYHATITPETIIAAMGYQTKAIAIVQPGEQAYTLEVLEKLSKEPYPHNVGGNPWKMEARKIAHWRQSADLWMIRRMPENVKWKDSE